MSNNKTKNWECLFCNYSKNPEKKILDTKHFYGFYDDQPITKGHFLVISKRHTTFFKLNSAEQKELHHALLKAHEIINNKYHPDTYNIVSNDGELAGRTVPHISIHLIPRYKGDVDNPIGTGVRTILGIYSAPVKPKLPYLYENEFLTEAKLKKLRYNPTTDKKFFLGLKVIIRNDEGKVFVIVPKKDAGFVGKFDLPGGRCEHRDKDEVVAVQRE